MASLIVTVGESKGDYYPLGARTIVVGRAEGVDIQVLDDRVSRKHLQVRHDASKKVYIATDMKSANGSAINGRPLSGEAELRDGDEIRIGDSSLFFTTSDFADKESAWSHFKKVGERRRSTLM